MKSLKITFAVLSLLVLTVSGTSSDKFNDDNDTTFEQSKPSYDLITHTRKNATVEKNS